MKNSNFFTHPSTRREFFKTGGKGIGLLAFSQFAPAFLTQSVALGAPTAEKDRTILVLIQLAGGNDGLNTVIPYEDNCYYNLRPTLGIKKNEAIRINDQLGLHPAMSEMGHLLGEGKLGIIQNVGYPNPNRSHFRSMEIWETASGSDEFKSTGWIGRYLDNACSGAPEEDPEAIHMSSELPPTFYAADGHRTFGAPIRNRTRVQGKNDDLLASLLDSGSGSMMMGADEQTPKNAGYLQQTLMDTMVVEERIEKIVAAYQTRSDYESTPIAQSLKRVAALIAAGLDTRVYFVSHGGFDTHANQAGNHERLLGQLSRAMAAFQADLDAKKLDQQVLTATFSEFGRRPNENDGGGTDHGTAAPLFIMGPSVKQSLIGTAPDLNLAKNADLKYSTDFRSVYQTVLNKWLNCDAKSVLGGDFGDLGII